MWTLDTALPVVRALQFKALQFGYHIALGGGVLNKGQSDRDLDIVVMPLDSRVDPRRDRFLAVCGEYLGKPTEVGVASVPEDDRLFRFTDSAGRIADLLFYAR